MTGKFIHILLLCCFFCGPMAVVSACSDKQGLESTTNALTSVALIPQPESLVYGSNNIALPSLLQSLIKSCIDLAAEISSPVVGSSNSITLGS